MIDPGRYTSGRVAVANLSASIDSLELRRAEGTTFDNLEALSRLLFLRGDLLGRIMDHDRAELIATEAIAMSPGTASALYIRARLAGRFHRFEEASALLDQALLAGSVRARMTAKGGAAAGHRDATSTRWFCVKDWRKPILIHALGAPRLAAGGNGSMDGRRNQHVAALDADDSADAAPPSGNCCSNGASGSCRSPDRSRRATP
jgi:hypothetical protein